MPETDRLMDPLVGAKGKLSLDVKKNKFTSDLIGGSISLFAIFKGFLIPN